MPGWIDQTFVVAKAEGIDLFTSYYGVFQGNPVGGLSHEAAYSHLLVFGGEVNLERHLGWRGASLILSGLNATGRNLSDDVGNFFTVSQAYTSQTFALSNLALRQELFDRRIEFRVGRMGPGQFFASLPATGLQVSGGINGNPASLSANIPFGTSTGTTWAAFLKVNPTKTTYASGGVFQASPRSGNRDYHGVDFSIRPGDGTLVLGEIGWHPTFGRTNHETTSDTPVVKTSLAVSPGLPGIYKLGAYFANYTFSDFQGGTESNAVGFYAMGQQMLWRNADRPDQSFSLWGGLTYSPQQTIAEAPLMGFFGAIYQSLIPSRDDDQLLFTALMTTFGRNYATSQRDLGLGNPTFETALEASYVIQLGKHVSVQPDVQWIVRPGGTGSIPNALVLGVQVTAQY
ncbi:MAG: carbohydrate porin [Chthoniobacterales bacterium]